MALKSPALWGKIKFASSSLEHLKIAQKLKNLINYSNEEKYYKHFIIHRASSALLHFALPLISIEVDESIFQAPDSFFASMVRVFVLVSHSPRLKLNEKIKLLLLKEV